MRGARGWLVLAAGLLLTACQSADAAAPHAAVPAAAPSGAWTRGTGAEVLDVRPGDHRADDATILAAATAAGTAVSRVWGSGWHRPPVVVAVPDTVTMARLAGRPVAATNGLVAVTTLDRVYLDVPAWLALSPAGRQVAADPRGHPPRHRRAPRPTCRSGSRRGSRTRSPCPGRA